MAAGPLQTEVGPDAWWVVRDDGALVRVDPATATCEAVASPPLYDVCLGPPGRLVTMGRDAALRLVPAPSTAGSVLRTSPSARGECGQARTRRQPIAAPREISGSAQLFVRSEGGAAEPRPRSRGGRAETFCHHRQRSDRGPPPRLRPRAFAARAPLGVSDACGATRS
ncbi:MAG: hypothetical protein H6699_11165 [Myxococcales bacterium]|nr:hypothetical protein [Myxococcales bacterium]